MSRIKSHIFDSLVGDIEDGTASQQIEYDQQTLGIVNHDNSSISSDQRGRCGTSPNGHSKELQEPDAGVQF
jgi:hypothetical protein